MKKLIERHFKVWGIKFETSLPPEFFISEHAEQRMRERVKVSKEKMAALVVKAWYAKPVPHPKMELTKNRTAYFHNKKKVRVCRELMGKVYVFTYIYSRNPLPPQKLLITVI